MADRPLECSECKRPIAVCYTEIVKDNIVHTSMCAECPVLQRHLHGIPQSAGTDNTIEGGAGLCCGTCGTTLDSIRMGAPLGCSECYEVFGDVLIAEMLSSHKISPRLINKKSAPMHIGRAPGETTEMNPALRLLALNEALNETLTREDYEQAAWLRDQIKELMENSDEGKK